MGLPGRGDGGAFGTSFWRKTLFRNFFIIESDIYLAEARLFFADLTSESDFTRLAGFSSVSAGALKISEVRGLLVLCYN